MRSSVKLKPEAKQAILHIRVILRPATMAFPFLYLFFSRNSLLVLVGSVTLFFLAIDFARLTSEKINLVLFNWLSFFL